MSAGLYRIFCPDCGAAWELLAGGDAPEGPGTVLALAVCDRCGEISSVSVRLAAGELRRYRTDILKTIRKMCEGFDRARARMEEKRRQLALSAEAEEGLRRLDEKLAALRPPDVKRLEKRAEELAGAARSAPRKRTRVDCPRCGRKAAVHRESREGFKVPCPRCGAKLLVRLKGLRAPGRLRPAPPGPD